VDVVCGRQEAWIEGRAVAECGGGREVEAVWRAEGLDADVEACGTPCHTRVAVLGLPACGAFFEGVVVLEEWRGVAEIVGEVFGSRPDRRSSCGSGQGGLR